MYFASYNLASEKIIYSTELAVTYMVSDIANAIESSQTTMDIFLDLFKAFDAINHNILLSKLCHCGNANKWFKSYRYLSNRRHSSPINLPQYSTRCATRINFRAVALPSVY